MPCLSEALVTAHQHLWSVIPRRPVHQNLGILRTKTQFEISFIEVGFPVVSFSLGISRNLSLKKALTKLMHIILNVFVFVLMKRSKLFFHHTRILVVCSPVHTNAFSYENPHFLIHVNCLPIVRTKTTENADENDSIRRFFGTVFKSLCFHLSTLETEHVQNHAFSKGIRVWNRLRKPPFSSTFSVVFDRKE